MKKIILFSFLFLFVASAFSVDLYLGKYIVDEDELQESYNSAVKLFIAEAKKLGVNVSETNKKVSTNQFSLSSIDSMSNEELEEAARDKDEQYKDELEAYKRFGIVIDDDDYKNPYREKLEERKRKRLEEQAFKYPYIEIQDLHLEWSHRNNSENVEFEFYFYTANDSYESYNFSFISSANDAENIDKYLTAVCALAFEKSPQKKSPPVFLDAIDLVKYLGKETEAQWQTRAKAIGLSDGSVVVRDGNRVAVFSAAYEFKTDLTSKLDSSLKNIAHTWLPYSPDGRSVKIVSPSYNKSFAFDSNFAPSGSVSYNYPAQVFNYGVTYNGDIYIYENYDGRNIVIPGTDDKPSKKIDFGKTGNQHLVFSPDNKIWSNRNTDNAIEIYNIDGKLNRVVLTSKKIDTLISVFDDSFIAFASDDNKNNYFSCFDIYGREIYSVDIPDEMKGTMFTDYRNGIYYFMNYTSGAVVRFVDENAQLPQFMKTILAIRKERAKDSKNPVFTKRIAEAYKEAGGNYAYYDLMSQYLEKSPGDAAAAEQHLLARVELEKVAANDRAEKAFALYDEYGVETARPEYQEAMKIVERLKRQVPWDTEVQKLQDELLMTFEPERGAAQTAIPSLKIESIELTALFPAMLNSYSTMPSGLMTVSNVSGKPIKNVSVSTSVRRYMDFASSSEVIPEIKASEKNVPLPIITQLNSAVLNLNEDTSVQMQFTLQWEEDGIKKSTSVTRPVTIYRKSTMIWEDAAMLACFITANDPAVSDFVFANLTSGGNDAAKFISDNFTKAMRLSNALGAIPLKYVSDPVSPAAENVGNIYAIDTVRFPSETLSIKGGDCDDMTALFCSVLESAGIKTSIVTTPGHVFAAFDAGIKSNSVWRRNPELRVIEYRESVWIPVEVTMLSSGFFQAWKTASSECFNEKGKILIEEFKVVSDVRADFPPVNFKGTANAKIGKMSFGKLNSDSQKQIHYSISKMLNALKQILKTSDDFNNIARIYFLIGENDNAINVLNMALKIDPNYRKTYANLASVYKAKGDMANYNLFIAKANALG